MEETGILDLMGRECNTDKASSYEHDGVVHQGHDYLKYYEEFLSKFRNKRFALIELGCAMGASVKMWSRYFPQASIITVDLNDPPIDVLNIDNVTFIKSDVTSDDLPKILYDKAHGKAHCDIYCIIDDSSHVWGDMRLCFERFFPLLQKGGYYIVEDLEGTAAGFFDDYVPKAMDVQPFFEYALDRMNVLRASRASIPEAERPLFGKLPKHIQEIERSIDMAIVLPGAIVFRKK